MNVMADRVDPLRIDKLTIFNFRQFFRMIDGLRRAIDV